MGQKEWLDRLTVLVDALANLLSERHDPFTPAPNGASLADAIRQTLASKTSSGRRAYYVKSLAMYLRRFAEGRENAACASVTTEDVLGYLSKFSGHSSATHLNRISTMFALSVKRGWCHANPCDKIERPTIDAKTIRILTPEQADKLLSFTPQVMRPYLVLCLWCGIRPAECEKLTWADVNLESRTVTINAAASKVRARRVVTLPERAALLLEASPLRHGKISPSSSTVRRWKRSARKVIGGDWPADVMRHTALSYHLAWSGDAGKVATMAGNSVGILKRHYDALASKSDAARFFNL